MPASAVCPSIDILREIFEFSIISALATFAATTMAPAIPEGLLPSYLSVAFGELYQEDALVVFGKGLGWLSLLASFVRFYADVEEGHLAVMEEEEEEDITSKNKKCRKK